MLTIQEQRDFKIQVVEKKIKKSCKLNVSSMFTILRQFECFLSVFVGTQTLQSPCLCLAYLVFIMLYV